MDVREEGIRQIEFEIPNGPKGGGEVRSAPSNDLGSKDSRQSLCWDSGQCPGGVQGRSPRKRLGIYQTVGNGMMPFSFFICHWMGI